MESRLSKFFPDLRSPLFRNRQLMRFVSLVFIFLLASQRTYAGSSETPSRGQPSARTLRAPTHAEVDSIQIPTDWLTVAGTYAQVSSAPEDQKIAIELSRHADQRAPELASILGTAVGPTIRVLVAPDHDAFSNLQPGTPPQWADGTAWPKSGLIFLKSPSIRVGTARPLPQVLDHELVHVLLGRAFGTEPVPRWLQEGAAQVLSKEFTPDHTRRLGAGVFGDNLLDLETLTRNFPLDPMRAQLAYAQSADFVAFINNEYGSKALPQLIAALTAGDGFGHAVRKVTGNTVTELDHRWRSRLASSPFWLGPLVSDTSIFATTGFVFVIGGFLMLRRRRRTLDRWEQEEAFWDQFEFPDPHAPDEETNALLVDQLDSESPQNT